MPRNGASEDDAPRDRGSRPALEGVRHALRRPLLAVPLVAVPVLALVAALMGATAGPVVGGVGAVLLGLLTAAGCGAVVLRQRTTEAATAGVRARADARALTRRLLDDLPIAVLLFGDGPAYANPPARSLLAARSGGRPEGGDRGNRGEDRDAGTGGDRPEEAAAVDARELLGADGLADAVRTTATTGRSIQVEVERDGRSLRARVSRTAGGEVALVVIDLTETRRLDAVRRDFVTNASHELKTPVAGIQALAESLSLAVDRDPVRARRLLDRLNGEAARLARLVRDLLDLARLEEAAAQTARRVDLAALTRQQADRFGTLAEERGVTLHVDAPGEASVVGVPADLRTVVANLLENAVLYNREGGQVHIGVRRDRGDVRLRVADTGIGIPESDHDRVFERFYRVDKGRSRAAGGTGLGLSLVRHAVLRHGGSVTVGGRPQGGSVFTVVLPVDGVLGVERGGPADRRVAPVAPGRARPPGPAGRVTAGPGGYVRGSTPDRPEGPYGGAPPSAPDAGDAGDTEDTGDTGRSGS